MYRIIVLNPGSTSTKVAVYEDDQKMFSETIDHPASGAQSDMFLCLLNFKNFICVVIILYYCCSKNK